MMGYLNSNACRLRDYFEYVWDIWNKLDIWDIFHALSQVDLKLTRKKLDQLESTRVDLNWLKLTQKNLSQLASTSNSHKTKLEKKKKIKNNLIIFQNDSL
ncbi:hypothetical protein ACKWTF_015928 [Chironomus riparius]